MVVHGDDFTALGDAAGLDKYEAGMQAASECKLKARLRHDPEDAREMRVLNKTIRVTGKGLLYEPDPRHAELMIRNLGLEGGKGAVTPGVKPTDHDLEALKDGAPEPWDQERWLADGECPTSVLIDWSEHEIARVAALDRIFGPRKKKLLDDPMDDDSMEVDFDESEDVDMGCNEEPDRALEIPQENSQPFDRRGNSQIFDPDEAMEWKGALEKGDGKWVNAHVRFSEHVEVHAVPNFFHTYSKMPRTFVLDKKGNFILLVLLPVPSKEPFP